MKITIIRSRTIDSSVFKLADTLSSNGYTVQMLLWDRKNNFNKELNSEYDIKTFNLKAPYEKFSIIFYLPFWWLYEFYYILKTPTDVYHSCDLDTLWPAIFAKILKRKILFYSIYDFYANNFYNKQGYILLEIIRRFIEYIEKLGISFSDHLFLVDESRYKEIKGSKINNLSYIYNSPPSKKNESSKFSNERILIFYAGLIDLSRGLKFMIDAVKDMNNVELIFAGTGKDLDLIKLASSKNKNIEYIGFLDYDKVIQKTHNADILFSFYDTEIPANTYASSNKLFEAMMCEKPIIVSDGNTMVNIVKNEECGLVVNYGKVEELKEALFQLIKSPELRKKLGKNGRQAYEYRYGWHIMEKRLIAAYKKVENNERA
ncbi:MAG: glycosyltransferase family 4 protein [Methanobacteriaceae archaeon]|nr:glycosyltransferase family 4 protein [Methanobacteriaceae archaeon]